MWVHYSRLNRKRYTVETELSMQTRKHAKHVSNSIITGVACAEDLGPHTNLAWRQAYWGSVRVLANRRSAYTDMKIKKRQKGGDGSHRPCWQEEKGGGHGKH